MSIRDVAEISKIFKSKIDLGLQLDNSIFKEFEKKKRYKNFLFLSGIDLIYEFFNFERKLNNNSISKYVKFVGNNPSLNKLLTEIADRGITF